MVRKLKCQHWRPTMSETYRILYRALDRRSHAFLYRECRPSPTQCRFAPSTIFPVLEAVPLSLVISQVSVRRPSRCQSHHVRTCGSCATQTAWSDPTRRASDEGRFTVEAEVHMWRLVTKSSE